ncbi:MAG: hypothetical protein JSR82_17930 [Verrucomicrobia bacterium]|nr:hypothetical protein [Verrucomicrobiota bacterium]
MHASPHAPPAADPGAAYASYLAHILVGEDTAAAQAKGQRLQGAFPGVRFNLVAGGPCSRCEEVEGPDPEKVKQIRLWLNTTD